jgi:hypothetical protein
VGLGGRVGGVWTAAGPVGWTGTPARGRPGASRAEVPFIHRYSTQLCDRSHEPRRRLHAYDRPGRPPYGFGLLVPTLPRPSFSQDVLSRFKAAHGTNFELLPDKACFQGEGEGLGGGDGRGEAGTAGLKCRG